MKINVLAVAAFAALLSSSASAQVLDLAGTYRCVVGCETAGFGQAAFISQSGWNLRIVNEAGIPARAWIDWPGHIWVQYVDEGAVYSADGMTIQFDDGTIWERDIGQWAAQAPVAVVHERSHRMSAGVPASATSPHATGNAFDGIWHVLIQTESGGCDRTYRYAMQIHNGTLVGDLGASVNLSGHVSSTGAVRVSVSSGGQEANGEGRLTGASGSGYWRGEGSAGSCAGIWHASRAG